MKLQTVALQIVRPQFSTLHVVMLHVVGQQFVASQHVLLQVVLLFWCEVSNFGAFVCEIVSCETANCDVAICAVLTFTSHVVRFCVVWKLCICKL